MLLIGLIIITTLANSFIPSSRPDVWAFWIWVFGSVLLSTTDTPSGKVCKWFWAITGVVLAWFAVSNHFSDND